MFSRSRFSISRLSSEFLIKTAGRHLLFGLAAILSAATNSSAATNIEFVVDLSGSMRQKLGAETQIDSARKALANALAHIQPGSLVAVRVYGHRVEQTDKAGSCKDTELLVPFGPVNAQAINGKVAALTPKGYTPIAFSLQETRNDLYDVSIATEADKVIILLTDGEETCGGDPVAEVKKLKDEGFKLTVYTIGFNVNDVARDQLKAIAAEGGGKYFDAKSGAELSTALEQATTESALINKTTKVIGTPIRGGNHQDDAVAIQLDTEYRLDHHQKKDQWDYFSFEASPADEVTVTLNTFEHGISIDSSGKVSETEQPYGGASLIDPARNGIKTFEIIGDRNKVSTYKFRPETAGRYIVSIGSAYAPVSKDGFTFKVTKTSKGDADTDKDAGNNDNEALPIEAKKYIHNSIGDGDKIDVFSFDGKAGDEYFVGIIPSSDYSGYLNLEVHDEYRQKITNESTGSGAGLKSKPFKLPDDGTYFVQIEIVGGGMVDYALALKKVIPLEGGPKTETNPGE